MCANYSQRTLGGAHGAAARVAALHANAIRDDGTRTAMTAAAAWPGASITELSKAATTGYPEIADTQAEDRCL